MQVSPVLTRGTSRHILLLGMKGQKQPYTSRIILFLFLLILLGASPSTEALEREGLGEMRLTDDGHSYFAAWSPDGREILVTRPGEVVESGEGWQTIFDLWLLSADGEAAIKLTGNAAYPVFSLDGEEIAYLSFVKIDSIIRDLSPDSSLTHIDKRKVWTYPSLRNEGAKTTIQKSRHLVFLPSDPTGGLPIH